MRCRERLLARVSEPMSGETTVSREALAALVAREGLLAGVNEHMPGETAVSLEALAALVTHERLHVP